MEKYKEFLKSKQIISPFTGFEIDSKLLNKDLFPFQRDICKWALKRGKAALWMDCGLGKGQPLDSNILTEFGWVKIQELVINDKIISSDGKSYKVTGIFPKCEQNTYRIYFSDKTSFVVDEDHLHFVRTNNQRQRGKEWRILTTKDLLNCHNLRYGKEGKSRNYDIPIVKPVIFGSIYKSCISPYVLGVLLGDGYLKGNMFISAGSTKQEIIDRVQRELPEGVYLEKKKDNGNEFDYIIKTGLTGNRKHYFRQELEDLGLLGKVSYEKFIPKKFLLNKDYSSRLDLLRGLMDTDGYIKSTSQYSTCSKALFYDVLFLIRSLGGIPTCSQKIPCYKYKGEKRKGRLHYTLTFSLKTFNPFYLRRKADKWNSNPRQNGRWIDRIEFEKRQKTICISVNSPDNSYVTDNFIVTHNTILQLDWAEKVSEYENGNVLILAPLAVSKQTKREGDKFGIKVNICKSQDDVRLGINITNYEKLHKFNSNEFVGIVLDESSILKGFNSKTRKQVTESFIDTKYKLCCTATPSPNDFMELGNHAEFMGVMKQKEMLATFFVHDGGDVGKWRLKKHAELEFWKWLSSWAIYMRKPSDLGYDDGDFILPKLRVNKVILKSSYKIGAGFFGTEAKTLNDQREVRRKSLNQRIEKIKEIVSKKPDDSWLIWCDLNIESQLISKAIPNAIEITGSDSDTFKEDSMLGFSEGKIRILVTKPKLSGHGMNWQHCSNVIFAGLSHSFEAYYQAVRRCWRFGQRNLVEVYIVMTDKEMPVLKNINRKEKDAERLALGMTEHVKDLNKREIRGARREVSKYMKSNDSGKNWRMIQGDCVEVVKDAINDNEIDYSIFSPPFLNLYVYSDSDRDMGNNKTKDEFMLHFGFLVKELFRVTKQGRLCSIHCQNIASMKERDGFIGIKDFRGDIIRLFQQFGWIYHSEVCIWKNPATEMQRTKALGLLHKQLKKDSSMSRMGAPDYVVTMRKPGENLGPITHTIEDFPVEQWRIWASPIWMDINQSGTLQYRSVREQADERHISPLQLEVIKRNIILWSNPGDLILSPFAGIGSEGVVSLEENREFVGVELKSSYYKQAVANLKIAKTSSIFDKLK